MQFVCFQYWIIFHLFPLSEPTNPGLNSGEGQGPGHPEADAEPDRGSPETGLHLQVLPEELQGRGHQV